MRTAIFQILLLAVFCAACASISFAETLIYNNALYEGYFTPGYNYEIFDYGTSSGGLVSKFTFGYRSTSVTSRILIRFFRNVNTSSYYPGILIKTITILDLPSTGGTMNFYEYVLPESDRFTLPSGVFGYSITVYSTSTNLAVASGGAGQENEMWDYYEHWLYGWGWYPFWFGGSPWAGLYMKVYTAPPINEITCDIKGYKFDDTDSDGSWDEGEAGLPHWEMYLDENNDGAYQLSEPNAVTDPNGMYFFENVDAPATYTIREIMKDGWSQTLPGVSAGYGYVLSAEPNTLYTELNFGNTTSSFTAFISGKKFHDQDGDTTYDAGEPGLYNQRVYIDINQNSTWDTGEPSDYTDTQGNYQLVVTAPGTYTVAEEIQAGWVQTYPTDACTHTVTIDTPDQVVAGINFGDHTFSTYGGGSGTEADPYLIGSYLHLQALGSHSWHWNKHFKMTANVVLNKYKNEEFNLIGRYNYHDLNMPFSGTFNGNGYYIGRFSYTYTGIRQEYIGLFGYVHGTNARITNLTLYDTAVDTQGSGINSGSLVGWLRSGTVENCYTGEGLIKTENFEAGGLVGECSDGIVTNCHARIDVEGPDGGAGGLIGYNWDGIVTDCSAGGTISGHMGTGGLIGQNGGQIYRCYANADVTGFQYTGGLVGENDGVISQCYAQGTVQTVDDNNIGLDGNEAGGLVGRNINGGSISDCWASTAVTGDYKLGGLVGLSWSTSGTCTITDSYAVGPVSGISSVGGLLGQDSGSVITGCVWDTQTSGRLFSAGGTGKTTWQMKNEGTFEYMGWDMTTPVWNSCPAVGYPALAWQSSQCPGGVTMKWTAVGDVELMTRGVKVLTDGTGNVVVASQNYSPHDGESNYDFMVSKYDADGDHLWTQTYDSDPEADVSDNLIDMAVDSAGNIYLTGDSYQDILTVKYSPNGVLLWDRLYNSDPTEPYDDDRVRQIAVDAVGNVYLAADKNTLTPLTYKDFNLIKYSTDGVFQWARSADGGGDGYDMATGLVIDSTGNAYVAGEAEDAASDSPIMIVKYNPAGVLQWSEFYYGPDEAYLGLYQLAIDSDDNIYLAGVVDDTNADFLLLKYDTAGILQWDEPFDLAGRDQDSTRIALDDAGNIYLAGVHNGAVNDDYLVVKYSAEGEYQWHQTYNGPTDREDGIMAVAVDAEQNVYVTGIADYYRVGTQVKGGRCTTQKYDTNGNLIWSTEYDGHQDMLEIPQSIAASESADVYITGEFEGRWVFPEMRVMCYTDCSWPGDADADYKVNLVDFSVVAANWLDTSCDECQKADWTGDGNVLMADALVLAENWLAGTD